MLFKICAVALQVLSHNLYTVLCIPHDPAALEDHFRDDDDGPVSSQGYMPYLNKYILDKVHSLSYSLTGGIVFGDRLYISSSVWQCVFVHVYLLVSITQTGEKYCFYHYALTFIMNILDFLVYVSSVLGGGRHVCQRKCGWALLDSYCQEELSTRRKVRFTWKRRLPALVSVHISLGGQISSGHYPWWGEIHALCHLDTFLRNIKLISAQFCYEY